MDLLGGYGSGSESDQEAPSAGGRATLLADEPERPSAAPAAASAAPIDPSKLLSSLPAPSGNQAPLFSGLPRAQQKKKVTVQFRVPISYDPADVKTAAEDEEPAKKRQRSTRGLSLSELLPAPKHASAAGGRRLDVLGGGAAAAAAGRAGGGRRYDSDDDEIVPGTEDRSGMVDLRPGEAAADGNEAYRVDAGAAAAAQGVPGAAQAAAQQYDAAAQEQYAQWQAYYAQHGGHEYNPQQQAAAAHAAAQAVDPAEAMLQAALAAEREKAARQGRQAAVAGIEIKEVSGEAIKAMAPGQRAEVNALRNAFGADYEAKLRQEAGESSPDPSKLAKRRHQIGSLYHQAKQKELEQLEMRAQGAKSKAASSRKYGW